MAKNQKIVLLEFKDEAEAFLDYCEKNGFKPEEFRIISLQPTVHVFLKNKGIVYETTLEYLPNESHSRILVKSEGWVKELERNIAFQDSVLKETYNNSFIFYARFYIFHLLCYTEVLSQLKKKHNIKAIYICTRNNNIVEHDLPIIKENERFLGAIAEMFAKANDIEFFGIQLPMIVEEKTVEEEYEYSAKETMLSKVYSQIWSRFIGKKEVVLLTTTGYNVGRLVEQLKMRFNKTAWVELTNNRPSWCISAFLGENLSKILPASKIGRSLDARIPFGYVKYDTGIKNKKILNLAISEFVEKMKSNWSEKFEYCGVNFMHIMQDKIKKDLLPHLLRLSGESVEINEIFGRLRIKLLISPFARDRALMITELCKQKGIPTLMISHGTLIEPENELEEIEYYHMGLSLNISPMYDYVALQTPPQERHFIAYKAKTTGIKTGNLILAKTDKTKKDELKEKIIGRGESKKIVLYYPDNTRTRHSMRFQVFQTSDEFLAACRDLVNVVNNMENIHLVIRIHSGGFRPSPEEFKELLPESNNVTVIPSKRPFSEELAIADIAIGFSSTAIEDALQNNIPVLLYDNTKRYRHLKKAQRLAKDIKTELNAVYYINNSDYLETALRWIVGNHLNRPNVEETIFKDYKFNDRYYENLVRFLSEKIGD